MTWFKSPITTLGAALALLGLAAGGALIPNRASARAPATAPDAQASSIDDEFVVTKTRLIDIPQTNYIYSSVETSLSSIKEVASETMEPLTDAIKAGKFTPKGPAIMIYHGMTADPDKKFTLDMGFPVADKVQAFDDFKVRKLPVFHCASVIMSGPSRDLSQAWQAAYEDLMAAGLQPADEAREEYLKWDAQDSPNNVVLIEVGVK